VWKRSVVVRGRIGAQDLPPVGATGWDIVFTFLLVVAVFCVVVMVTPPTLMCTLSKLALLSVLTKDAAFFLNHVPLKVGAPQRHFFGSNPHPQHPSMFLSWLPAIKTRGNSFLYDICRRRFLAIFSFWGFETHST